MSFALWLIGNHPEVQTAIQAELDTVFGESDRAATNDDLARLKYLERTIKEALRLVPPVPMFLRAAKHEVECGKGTCGISQTVIRLIFQNFRCWLQFS